VVDVDVDVDIIYPNLSLLVNPSGEELDLDPFRSKNRLSSISPFIVPLVLTM
jgi:hypothetical protein